MWKKVRFELLDYIIVWFVLMCSGTVIFNIKYNSIFIPLFFVAAFGYHLFRNRGRLRIENSSMILALVGCIAVNCLIHISSGVAYNGIVQIFLYLVATSLVCGAMTFARYKKVYQNIVAILCMLSVVMQVLADAGVIAYAWTDINGISYPLGYGHMLSWWDGRANRLSGMFSEPGMYQIIILFALLYLFDDRIERPAERGFERNIAFIKELIYIFTILMTKSTAGYIMLVLVLVYYLWKKKDLIHRFENRSVYLMLFPIAGVLCLLVLSQSSVLLSKFSNTNISYMARSNDWISGARLILQNPIFGYGYKSELYNEATARMNIGNISSGLEETVLAFGVLFFAVLIWYTYRSMKRSEWRISKWFIVLILILENTVEACLFFPAVLVFVIGFRSDRPEARPTGEKTHFTSEAQLCRE